MDSYILCELRLFFIIAPRVAACSASPLLPHVEAFGDVSKCKSMFILSMEKVTLPASIQSLIVALGHARAWRAFLCLLDSRGSHLVIDDQLGATFM